MKPIQRPGRAVAGAVTLWMAAACQESPREQPAVRDSSAVEGRPGVRFDPATLRRGDTIGTLVVDFIEARPTVVDSTYVGTARFRGRLELTGRLMTHPDADLRHTAVCVEASAASAARIPRWQHDERRPWFCFTNPEAARRALGGQGSAGAFTMAVEDFTIHRGLSDEVNSARFVGVVSRAMRDVSSGSASAGDAVP